jgi:hypothetical protein
MTVLAGTFGFAPSELDALDSNAFAFWLDRAEEWHRWRKGDPSS